MPRSLPRCSRSRAPRREAGIIGEVERHVHAALELAAIIGEGEAGLERHRAGGMRLRRRSSTAIDAQLGGGEIDHALDHIGRLGPAVAAIGPHRIGVGEDRRSRRHGSPACDRRRRACRDCRRTHCRRSADRRRALAMVLTRKPRNLPSRSSASSASVTLSRACASPRKASRARAGPFDRPAGDLGAQQHQRHLVIDRRLHAEAAADIAGDDADLALRHFEHALRQLGAEGVRALQRGVDGVAVLGGVVVADRAARLHGRAGDAVDHEVAAARRGRRGRRPPRSPPCRLRDARSRYCRGSRPTPAARPASRASAVETTAGSGS